MSDEELMVPTPKHTNAGREESTLYREARENPFRHPICRRPDNNGMSVVSGAVLPEQIFVLLVIINTYTTDEKANVLDKIYFLKELIIEQNVIDSNIELNV